MQVDTLIIKTPKAKLRAEEKSLEIWLPRADQRTTEADAGCAHPGPVQSHMEPTQ